MMNKARMDQTQQHTVMLICNSEVGFIPGMQE